MKAFLRIGGALAALLLVAPALQLASFGAPKAWGAEEEERPRNMRRVPSMSEATFNKLAEAQEFVDAEDLDGAMRVLNGMLDRSRRYNGNEIGNIHNMLGFHPILEGRLRQRRFATMKSSCNRARTLPRAWKPPRCIRSRS